MTIKDIVNKYAKIGHSFRDAQNLAAEEIVLTKIASSPLVDHVILKGGIVMFNLTKNDRRVTQDIDFDLIRYSVDENSIKEFVKKLGSVDDGVSASIEGDIEPLHQEDYQGVRVHLLLQDKRKGKLRIKLDIGVHTYSAIDQKRIAFSFEGGKENLVMKVNPCEQIFSEKLLTLARYGALDTRYKDIYDMYYLINNNLVDINKVKETLNLFFVSSKREPHTMIDLINSISDAFEDKNFSIEAKKPAFNWIDVDYEVVKETILNFILKL